MWFEWRPPQENEGFAQEMGLLGKVHDVGQIDGLVPDLDVMYSGSVTNPKVTTSGFDVDLG